MARQFQSTASSFSQKPAPPAHSLFNNCSRSTLSFSSHYQPGFATATAQHIDRTDPLFFQQIQRNECLFVKQIEESG